MDAMIAATELTASATRMTNEDIKLPNREGVKGGFIFEGRGPLLSKRLM